MQRDYLICSLAGLFIANDNSITGPDLRIKIDNELMKSCMTPLGVEPNDDQLLEELIGEVMIKVLGAGINRKQRRDAGLRKT